VANQRKKRGKGVFTKQAIPTPQAAPTNSLGQPDVPADTVSTSVPSNPPQEEAKPAFKIADRPHYVSIVFSIVALLISLMSWWESRSSRVSSQSSNRAVVEAVELEEVMNEEKYGHQYKITVKNFGRSPAIDIFISNTVIASKSLPSYQDYPSDVFEEMLDDLAPNYQKSYEIPFIQGREDVNKDEGKGDKFNMPEREKGEEIYLIGVLDYRDEPSNTRYLKQWCFRLGSNFGEHYVEPETPPKYQPCPSG